MSDTPETDKFVEELNEDIDVEFALLTAYAGKLERERDEARQHAVRLHTATCFSFWCANEEPPKPLPWMDKNPTWPAISDLYSAPNAGEATSKSLGENE